MTVRKLPLKLFALAVLTVASAYAVRAVVLHRREERFREAFHALSRSPTREQVREALCTFKGRPGAIEVATYPKGVVF